MLSIINYYQFQTNFDNLILYNEYLYKDDWIGERITNILEKKNRCAMYNNTRLTTFSNNPNVTQVWLMLSDILCLNTEWFFLCVKTDPK